MGTSIRWQKENMLKWKRAFFIFFWTWLSMATSISKLDTRHDTVVWWQGLYHACIPYTRITQFFTHQSSIISWILASIVTMTLQLQLVAIRYIFIYYALKYKWRRSRKWWMIDCFLCQQRKSFFFNRLKSYDYILSIRKYFLLRIHISLNRKKLNKQRLIEN